MDDRQKIGLAENVLIDYATANPAVLRVWLYGSRIWGEPNIDSDLDIAIELDPRSRPPGYSFPANWPAENAKFVQEIQPLVQPLIGAIRVDIKQIYSDTYEPEFREYLTKGRLIFQRH